MNYLDQASYEVLYARYIGRREKELLDLAGSLRGKRVFDLCGGAGRLSLQALKKGVSRVILVDQCEAMIDIRCWQAVQKTGKLLLYKGPVREFVEDIKHKADIVFCSQGVNYWFGPAVIGDLAKVMKRGGKFIFNTFNTKPSACLVPLSYSLNKRQYVELSWAPGNMVHHVQMCSGMAPHVTSFQWIPPATFKKVLEKWFKVKVITDNKTDIYVCTRR